MATEKRLIYMDDTIEKLRAYAERKHEAGNTELANGILKAANYIHNNIVRADAVEVVHGKWEIFDDGYGCELMCCSVCKSEFYDGDNDTVDHPHNYCPNCGAKMDGERKDNG